METPFLVGLPETGRPEDSAPTGLDKSEGAGILRWMILQWLAVLIPGACLIATTASAQWNLTGGVDYSRSRADLGGGIAYSIGVARTGPGIQWGVELGSYDLGRDHSEFRYTSLIPGEPPGIHISETSQKGWRLAASLNLLTIGRFRWTSSLGFYRFTGKYSSEIRDTTGQQVIRPRFEYGGSSNGAGVMTGIRADLVPAASDVGVSLEAAVHGVGLRSTGEEAGYGFFHYFTLGARLRLRL